ncbi:rod shape-determining protein MreD [Rhodalgimonas zhirmunskyi]|uniref:Rod shape-determining protein MreD n=1 Tax=Rhodalgimonas zhirmunskyi TaxID=2964767 RepID=A0AAJ1X4V4_9RHOB|nr:rod shape-determining protein MreD [Rhodoalgimonas zhirmunskyi]MDQ2094643.1 rod shape-determining protein MreD [Rhodoalgimonas zhirmunskyi]
MDEITQTRLWAMRALFALLCLLILIVQLLPLEFTPRSFAGPNLILAFSFAWVLRRPEYVPIWLVAAIYLLADLLLGRPPGLYAAMALLAFDHLRSRALGLRDMPFTVEWLSVAMAMAFTMLAYRLILAIAVVEMPGMPLLLTKLAMTILIYPLAAALTRFGFGLRKIAHGEVNALGQRQ